MQHSRENRYYFHQSSFSGGFFLQIMDESSENCPECGYSICNEICLPNANLHIGSEECQVLKALKNHEHIKEAQDGVFINF